jgi:hypothetical protein
LYLTAGLTNWLIHFDLDTLALPDGHHELTAVAYEGSHVRTQTRVSKKVIVTNSDLTADLALISQATNVVVGMPLQFSVTANGGDISRIELHGPGGILDSVQGQGTATFAVDSGMLGRGLHPFVALITRSDGQQFRTAPLWVRVGDLASPPPAFPLVLTAPPPVLSWPATPGRTYEVLRSTNGVDAFVPQGTVTATATTAVWQDPAPVETGAFYRVRVVE